MRFTKRFTPTGSAAIVLLTLLASSASAGGAARTHDGFFMRLSAGFGGASAKSEFEGASLEFSGTSSDANLAVGAMIRPNLALHGTLWGWSLSDPDVSAVDPLLGPGSGTAKGTLYMGAAGIGATYFFMPANTYVSASLGSGSLSGTDELDGNTNSGFAMDVTVGKEWWVGDSWGLGLSGDFQWFSCKDGDVDATWSGPGYGIRFSATFN